MTWINALRPRREEGTWQVALAARLTGNSTQAHFKTEPSEDGLGIARSQYWYVLFVSSAFGRVATIWNFQNDTVAASDWGSLTPFDSGGLWHDHIKVEPKFPNETEKRDFFQTQLVELGNWVTAFREWLAMYSDPTAYCDGNPPDGAPESRILMHAPNDSRAWTWEARISVDHINEACKPESIFWDSQDEDDFLNWIQTEACTLTQVEKVWLQTWCIDHGLTSTSPHNAIQQLMRDRLNTLDGRKSS